MSFKTQLEIGVVGESMIAAWFRMRGWGVLLVYEKELNTGKGPRLFLSHKQLIAPDMFIFRQKQSLWIEAKHKNAFSWYRIRSSWVTGIDLRHYIDYCEVDETTPFDVHLLFLHRGGQAKDSPADSPSGLYGNKLSELRDHESHRSTEWGTSGMVYWGIDALKCFATLDQVKEAYDDPAWRAEK